MKTSTLLLLLCFFVAAAHAQKGPKSNNAADEIRILLQTDKPYDDVISKIEKLGGVVHYQYENIDALAVTVPSDRVNDVSGFRETGAVVKDRIIRQSEPRNLERVGFEGTSRTFNLTDQAGAEIVNFTSVAPDGYFSAEADLTGSTSFWSATGHFGEGIIIGIMDSGLGPAPALGDRIVGGINFLEGLPNLDDGEPAISSANGDHGTWVASTAGADVAYCFPSGSTFALSVQMHLPSAIIPNFPGCPPDFEHLIPIVGQAPLADFFALKIFNVNGSTSTSVILAAFDKAIELKKAFDAGLDGGVNIQVLNGSFGGPTLFAGDDPFFAGMIERVTEAGIVTVFSAGNEGPSGITGGDPGTARNTLTVGATSVAAYERIIADLNNGLGAGVLWRANNTHQTAYFSGRGPTADGRTDPDIAAPGDWIFAQGAAGTLNFVSGTSFSAPNVAGAAALLLSAFPDATPDQIRGALLAGADPNALEDGSGPFDQGFGFLDVLSAYNNFGAPSPPDKGKEDHHVKVNVQSLGVDIINSRGGSRSTGWLLPGERAEFFVDTKPTDAGMTIQITVTPELPRSEQNFFFGDDALVAIHSAKTSGVNPAGDYRAGTPTFVPSSATFVMGPNDMEEGLIRVTVLGDWTNAGRVQAHVDIWTDKKGLKLGRPINGKVADDQMNEHSLRVPQGTSELSLMLDWNSDWSQWPTNNLDLYVIDPDNNLVLLNNDEDADYDGLSLDAPERITIADPMPGNWTLLVDGFTIWNGNESYKVISNMTRGWGKGGLIADEELAAEYELSDAYPNPFNPQTQFTLQLRDAQDVTIRVFDMLGRRVATLHDGALSAGEKHSFRFNAADLPSGVYVYAADGESFKATRRIVLMK